MGPSKYDTTNHFGQAHVSTPIGCEALHCSSACISACGTAGQTNDVSHDMYSMTCNTCQLQQGLLSLRPVQRARSILAPLHCQAE